MRSCHVWMAKAACAMVAALASPAWAVPLEMPFHGRVSFQGAPFAGQVNALTARLYSDPTSTSSGDKLWEASYSNVPVDAGLLRLVLTGGTPALDTAILTSNMLWLELELNGVAMAPRHELSSMPFAIQAAHAETLDGQAPEDFVVQGAQAAFSSLQAAGAMLSAQVVKIGTSATCNAGAAGTLRYNAGTNKLQACNGATWADLAGVGDLGTVSWSQITNKPAGFADDIDNVFSAIYQAGTGLVKTGTTFSVNTSVFQRRMSQACPPNHVVRAVAADGSVTCVDAGQTYTAPAAGGLAIDALNRVRLINCGPGQLLKHNGAAWVCGADAHATSFAALSGQMTDAQVPNNITVLKSIDADKVGGVDYSPVWDSTDAASLGGVPANQYVSVAALAALSAATDAKANDPAFNQPVSPVQASAICANSLPSDICRRDVFLQGASPMWQPSSIMRLSGGTWVYENGRCEYQGGMQTPDPELCGQDLMPDWMERGDQCGGFRQSTWDPRVWYAVAKNNLWDPTFTYTCPTGFRPMTTQEGHRTFNGPNNAGALVYQNQCGWNSTTFNGKARNHFRFGDSAKNSGSFKDSTHFDGQALTTTMTLSGFAGIICIDEREPAPLDWMDTSDECGGFKQSEFNPRIWYAVARRNVFDYEYNYTCPSGYKWATTAEAAAIFNTALNQGTTYNSKCGWTGNQMVTNGISRRYFRFSDSFKGATTLAAKDANDGEAFTVRYGIGDSWSSNPFAGIVCIDENYVPSPTDWMDTSDYCGGFRVSTWNPRFAFAVSKSSTWDPNRDYQCPAGWQWATVAEVEAAFQNSQQSTDQRIYQGQCGWTAANPPAWKGVNKRYFRVKNNVAGVQQNRYMESIHADSFFVTTANGTTAEFAGVVCRRTDFTTYPQPNNLEWMDTSDDCKGFRESSWDMRIRFAVSKQNVFTQNYEYTCPTGWKWATSGEYGAASLGFINYTSGAYKKYFNQCGWNGYNWQNRRRVNFFFRDTVPPTGSGLAQTRFYVDANHGEPHIALQFPSTPPTAEFAGIVCIRDNPAPLPSDWWMDTTDNCQGFRQSTFDPRVWYAVARKTTWVKNPPVGQEYQCPAGYTWLNSNQALFYFEDNVSIYNTATVQNGGRVYVGECGWSTQTAFSTQAEVDGWWHSLVRRFFRFSDSAGSGKYILSTDADGYYPASAVDGTESQFAGIICVQNAAEGLSQWMETSDNCGGLRESPINSNIVYAVSRGSIWDRNRSYTCPAGYRWANSNEIPWAGQGGPTAPTSVYQNQCGWSGINWNPGWRRGCNVWTNTGCGSSQQSPSPTHGEMLTRPNDFGRACTECLAYDPGTTCQSTGTTSGPDGKCNGVDEPRWRNGSGDNQLGECYYSPNTYSGNPSTMAIGNTKSDHCQDGICCGNSTTQIRTQSRRWFRFADSQNNNSAMDAQSADNAVPSSYSGVDQFGGIVCIKN